MSRRIRREETKLRKLLEENNQKSPDILSVTLFAESLWEASRIVEIFEETTGQETPFERDVFVRGISMLPVELYFIFDGKREYNRFIKRLHKEFPSIVILSDV